MGTRSRGFSLNELLVVVAIFSVILAVSLMRYEGHQFQRQIAEADSQRAQLFAALNGFYIQHCHSGSTPMATVAGLVASELLSSTEVAQSSLGNFHVEVIWASPAKLRVTLAVTGAPSLVQAVANQLAPTQTTGNTLVWEELPDIGSKRGDSEAWVFRSMYNSLC